MSAKRGSAHHDAKLSEPRVRRLRRWYSLGKVTMKELAEEFGVSLETIRKVIRRETWTHLPDEPWCAEHGRFGCHWCGREVPESWKEEP